MNIVISSKRFVPILGGSIQYAVMLARAFRAQGHQVTFVTRTPGKTTEVEGSQVMRLPGGRELLELAATADVLLQVDASWRDVWPFLFYRVPWFPTVHFGYPEGRISLRQRLELGGLKAAFRIGQPISVGHEVARSWGLRGEVIPNPYDDACFFHRPAAAAPRDVEVLFVGRLERSKGIFVLLEALESLARQSSSPIRAVFVGDGPDETELVSRIDPSHPQLHITLVGRQGPDGVAAWMRRSKVLAFPTTHGWVEASPLTPLEALACGCHIVASDNGGTRENIGPQGVLVPMGNSEVLARELAGSLTDIQPPDSSAVDAFLESRLLDKVAARYLDVFLQALKS